MNIFIEVIIPSLIILIANVFSHEYGSIRYEKVSAIFGWISAIFLFIWIGFHIAANFLIFFKTGFPILINISKASFQIGILSLITVFGREYEKILKPNAHFFEEKINNLYSFLKKIFKKK